MICNTGENNSNAIYPYLSYPAFQRIIIDSLQFRPAIWKTTRTNKESGRVTISQTFAGAAEKHRW